METMKRFLPLLLILCLLLCACGQKDTAQTTDPSGNSMAAVGDTSSNNETQDQAGSKPADSTTAPGDTEVLYRNPLNGAPMDKAQKARPYAVTINNIINAMPQCSVSEADMVFEILAEGGITRCLAVYSDLSGVEHIGSIRSARPYLVDIALGYDAIYVHHGGSEDGYAEISDTDTDDLDAMTNAGVAYYRDQARLDNGYSLEHTSFADGDDLISAAVGLGYAQTREEGVDYGLNFADSAAPAGGETANKVTVHFDIGGKTTSLTYNQETGTYDAVQYGSDYIDGNTGKAMSFRNIIFFTAETHNYTDDHNTDRLDIALTGEGDGYFACDGKIVPIRWSRESKTEPFTYTLTNGSPITLGVGNTYVAIAPLGSMVDYE